MPSIAQAWSTGPALIYVGVGSAYAPLFLGTCIRPPRIRLNPEYEPVQNDITGRKPYDHSFGGEDANVQAVFTRFNQSVLSIIQQRPRHNLAAVGAGDSPFGEIGTLMKTEGYDYPLWVVFPYYSKSAYSAVAGGIPGYKFYQSRLQGPDDIADIGPVARTTGLIWYCSYLTLPNGTNRLYSVNPNDFQGLPAAV